VLDLQRIRDAPVTQSPYPFFVVPNAVLPAEARNAASDFPAIGRPGAIDIEDTQFGAAFGALLDDLKGDAFRQLVADKFDLDLDGRDIVITVRGQVRLTDGNIHTDTPSKLVTILLYFNEPGQADGTSLRILKNGRDLDDYVAEIPPDLGTMVAFKVTSNCWHGHKPAPGKRLSLQMNYLSDVRTFGKHQLGRRLVTRLKRKLTHFNGRM
jgi:hypothetical protein